MANLPANTPIPITQDSQIVINNVPNYNKGGNNTQYQLAGISVQPNIVVYAYNTTNRGNNAIVASSAQITSQTGKANLSTKRTPVMMAAGLQCLLQGNGLYTIGPGTADTTEGYAAGISISIDSNSSGTIQPYPGNLTANLLIDPNNQLPAGYYSDLRQLITNPNATPYIHLYSSNVQRDLRVHIIGQTSSNSAPFLAGVIYLDDQTGVIINQACTISVANLSALWLLPLIAYDPPTNMGSFDIGDPKNDAVVNIIEA